MLLLSDTLTSTPVLSLQSGAELAQTAEPILDPRDLTIEAFYVSGPNSDGPLVLHVSDIRETGNLGHIIDDSTKLMPLDDLVRLQQIIDYGFALIGNTVFDERGNKLGKVSDYSYEPGGYTVQQLYIKQPILKRVSTTSAIVHRTQIISVANDKIIARSPTIRDHISKKANEAQSFVNPFRGQSRPEPESFDS